MPTSDGRPTNFEKLQALIEPCGTDDATKHWSEYPCVKWYGGRWISSPFGRRTSRRCGHKTVRRTAYMIARGEIPDTHTILDVCGDKDCVRPGHLYTRGLAFDLMVQMLSDPPSDPKQCIEWPLARDPHGYGRICDPDNPDDIRFVHRVAWQRVNGSISPDIEICHRCDNPPCFRIEHLFDDDHAGNMADAYAKRRIARGERVGSSKLTEGEVREAWKLKNNGMTAVAIAHLYGRSKATINDIFRGATWAWLDYD